MLRRQRGCKYVWNRSYGQDLHELAPSMLWTIGGDVSGVDYDEGDADVSVDDATPRGRIGLASDPLDASVVFATDPVGARRLDVERGLVTWSGNPYCHDPRTPALENSICRMSLWHFVASNRVVRYAEGVRSLEEELGAMGVDCPGWPAAMPMRTASFSPGWALLAGIRSDGAVALWDVRQACAAAVVKLPDSERAMFVHLDPALEAFGARETPVGASPGHLLASSGNGVLIFDVRRLEGGGAAPAAPLGRITAPAGTSVGACFVADHSQLVSAGGPKSPHALRWVVVAEAGGASDDELADATDPGGREKKKKQKLVKHQKRLPCRLANR